METLNALGEAVWEAVAEYAAKLEEEPEEDIRHSDFDRYVSRGARDIRLELRRNRPIGVWIAAGMGLGLVTFFAGFPIIAIHNGFYVGLELKAMVTTAIIFVAGPWLLALAMRDLFPAYISVESGHIWLDKGFRPIREICLEEIGGLRWNPSGECYIVFNQTGKTLAKFSTRDSFGPEFMNFLTDHNIRIRSEK